MQLNIPLGTQAPPTTLVSIEGVYYLPLMVDASGRLVVVGIGAGGAVEVIQDTPADLKAAVHGIEGSTQRQIVVDASGRLTVVGIGAGGAVEVIQDTPDDLRVGLYTRIGSAWQRQPLIHGYSVHVSEQVSKTATQANDSVSLSEVPAGYVYVYLSVGAYNGTRAITGSQFSVNTSGTPVFADTAGVGVGRYDVVRQQVIVPAGQRISCAIVGSQIGDTILIQGHGYGFNIAGL